MWSGYKQRDVRFFFGGGVLEKGKWKGDEKLSLPFFLALTQEQWEKIVGEWTAGKTEDKTREGKKSNTCD